MASQSERSFGSRLRKFRDAIAFIKKWVGFTPPRREESIEQLEALATITEESNKKETSQQKLYSDSVQVRQDHFAKTSGSIAKLLAPIKGAIIAQYGKESKVMEQVNSIVTVMRNTKLIKLPKDPGDAKNEIKISQSQQSYGSQTQYFKDIITHLQGAGGYTSANDDVTLPALLAKAAAIDAANDDVASNLQSIRTDRKARNENYIDIAERFTRLKAYALNKYGTNSLEYKSLTKLGL